MPPEIYQRLLNEMYGPIRRNEYRVEYNVRHFSLEEGRQMIKTRPDLMSVSEIQQVADSYGKGSSEYVDCLMRGDRVGQGHYCPLPPSEPYVRVSPHTAQAFQSLCSCAETGSSYFLFPLFLRDNLKHSS